MGKATTTTSDQNETPFVLSMNKSKEVASEDVG
jgi:hypothetical protein